MCHTGPVNMAVAHFAVDTPPGRLFSPYLECKVARRRLVVHVPAGRGILASVHCMYRGRVDVETDWIATRPSTVPIA